MAKPVLQIKGHTAESIKSLIRKDERYGVGIRLYAVYQVAKGQSSRKLEDLYILNRYQKLSRNIFRDADRLLVLLYECNEIKQLLKAYRYKSKNR